MKTGRGNTSKIWEVLIENLFTMKVRIPTNSELPNQPNIPKPNVFLHNKSCIFVAESTETTVLFADSLSQK